MRYLVALLLLATLTACGSGSNRQRVTIRFIHAVPDGQAVDIWVVDRNSKLFQDVAFATATKFISLEPGTYNIQIRRTGAARSTPPLAETGDVELQGPGDTYTAIFGGLVSAPEEDMAELRLDVYRHEFAEIDQQFARVRFVHNAPGVPTLDLILFDNDPFRDPTIEGSYEALEQYTSSDPAGLVVDAEDADQLQLQDNADGSILTQFTTGELPSQGEFFVVFIGSLRVSPRAEGAFQILVADQEGGVGLIKQNPRLYFMNNVADSITPDTTYAVDASYKVLDQDGEPVGPEFTVETNILYGDLGGDSGASILLPPGEYEFTFRVPGELDALGSEFSGGLLPGQQYLVPIAGRKDGTWPLAARFVAEAFDTTIAVEELAAENRWRVVHAAPDLEAVFLDLWINNEAVPWTLFEESISYGQVTGPPEGKDIGLDPFVLAIVKEDETAQFGLWDIVPVADAYQFVVLSGSIDPQLPVLIEGWDNTPELFFIDTTTQPWTVTPQSPR
ncbi:MAG: DUF4397 domain-containing protein [Planctomycetota bacterium]|jgi:hypothetical protein